MDATGLSPAEFLALDAQFHLTLAELSDNQVVTAIMAGLRNSIEGYVIAGAARLADWGATMDAAARRAPRHQRRDQRGRRDRRRHAHP